jgi:peroxiredoxin
MEEAIPLQTGANMRDRSGGKLWKWTIAATVLWGAACAAVGGAARGEDPPAAGPAAQTEAPSDPFAVPNGTPDELLKYIERLKHARPTSDSGEVEADFAKKQGEALLTAAGKILAGKPDQNQARAAVQYKLLALEILDGLGDPTAEKQLAALPAELAKAGYPALVREVRIALLWRRLKQADPTDKEAFAGLLGEVKTCLAEGALDRDAAHLAAQAAAATEQSGDNALAARTYAELATMLAKSEDRRVLRMATTMRGAARRLGLVGKPLALEGTTVDGKPLDWKRYAGKVVLVDFFATWCMPCRVEMRNIAESYDAYHARGFDVVSISIDEDRKALEDYLREHEHPWTVLLDESEAAGTDKSLATHYGIIGIPQTILVGRDGKVLALNVRGPQLGRELEKLLGRKGEKKEKRVTHEPGA